MKTVNTKSVKIKLLFQEIYEMLARVIAACEICLKYRKLHWDLWLIYPQPKYLRMKQKLW